MTTRGTLLADVGKFIDRTADVTTDADMLIRFAEAMVARKVRTRAQETVTTLTATSATVALPTDYLETIKLVRNDLTDPQINMVGIDVLHDSPYPNNTGPSELAAIEGSNLRIAPPGTATAAATFTLIYFARFTAMTAATDSTWLTTNAYDVFFAALLAAAGWRFRDAELHAENRALFDMLAEELNVNENRARVGGSPIENYREVPRGGA